MNGEKKSSFRRMPSKVYYAVYVKWIMPDDFGVDRIVICWFNATISFSVSCETAKMTGFYGGIIDLTMLCRYHLKEHLMSQQKSSQEKYQALKTSGALNSRAQKVNDPLFAAHEFFDPQDLMQVKYEMLRKVQKEGKSVKEACESFGFSRVWFYQIRSAYQEKGLLGLLPQKHGPKHAHKLSEEVMDFVVRAKGKDRSLGSETLAEMVGQQFGLRVHPRSIERGLARRKKKRSRP
jgi:transposase